MATRFINIDRETPLLLPPNLCDWVAADDPARLILALVENIDLGNAAVNFRGSGSEQYPPCMMLALLLHSYVHGVFSSREIERSTYSHVGVRYITGDTHPDHDTICKFRRENRELIKSAFRQSLGLAREVGVLQIGTVAMDGTKIKGDVSGDKTLSIEQIDQQIGALNAENLSLRGTIDDLLKQAETTDQREEKQSPALGGELQDSGKLKERLEQARQEIAKKERRRARLEAARAQFAERKRHEASGREAMREEIRSHELGRIPDKRSADIKPGDKVNLSDPDTSKMKGRHGYIQGYNAQAVADCAGSGLLLAAYVSQEASDRHQLQQNVKELEANLGKSSIDTALGDRGYDNTYQIRKIEDQGGPQMLCQQQRSKKEDPTAQEEAMTASKGPRGRPLRTRNQRNIYYQRLKEPGNREKLKRRRETIEPSFGITKEQMGFQRFHLRGVKNVDNEWRLVTLAFNIRKLNRNKKWIKKLTEKN